MKRLFIFTLGLFIFMSQDALAQKTVALATLDWQPYVSSDMPGYGLP